MDRKSLFIGLAIALFSVMEASTALFAQSPPPRADDMGSNKQGIADVVSANNKFAFKLFSELSKTDNGNIFCSPYSMSAALAMTYDGAKGKTAEEIKSVFHFPESGILRPNFAAIYNGINKEDKSYILKTGNALWIQKDYISSNEAINVRIPAHHPFLPSYVKNIEKYYGGKAESLDFIKEPEKSRVTINKFIEDQTNDKIKDLIPTGMLDARTKLVLTNAIYFKGDWKWEFDKADTKKESFFVNSSNHVETPMMQKTHDKNEYNFVETEDLKILELPYVGDNLSMLAILPTKDIGSIKPYLTAEKLNEYKSKMRKTKLGTIWLPVFEFDAKYFMKDALSNLGMPTAFSGNADFSGMTGHKDFVHWHRYSSSICKSW